jgi:hypothetical protein
MPRSGSTTAGPLVHVAVDETPGRRNPLLEVAAFRRVTDGIAARCEIPPQTAEADQIGSYRPSGN